MCARQLQFEVMGFFYNFHTLHIYSTTSHFAILGHVNDSCAAPVVNISKYYLYYLHLCSISSSNYYVLLML